MNEFKIRCSSISKIMGPLQGGLTDAEQKKLTELINKPSVTEKQAERKDELMLKAEQPRALSIGAQTYCKEWVLAEIYGRRPMFSKYTEKGKALEDEAVKLMGYEPQLKERRDSEFITGEPDLVLDESIIDIKCSWSHETFPVFDAELPDKAYWWQGQGYMHLFDKRHYRVAYCLLTTPANLDEYGLNYDNLPKSLRIKTFEFEYDESAISKVIERVRMCREYIETLRRDLRLDEF